MEPQSRIDDYSRTARTAPSSDSVSAVCPREEQRSKKKGRGRPMECCVYDTGLVGG